MPTQSAESPNKRCHVTAAEVRVSLPVIGSAKAPVIKRSRNAPLRAAVLIGVHLLIVGHVIHYWIAGRTLSPVEPSESMYAIELGQINAGAIFFALSILATLVFGRFFCGWGCHVVAYQDFCAWLMKKVGVRPRPFRARLLMYIPLGLAFYMFAWQSVRRTLFEWAAFARCVDRWPDVLTFVVGVKPGAYPAVSNHLMTAEFWKTFPGPVFAVLTVLVCGFGAVYFLGGKGFCTYGCPYGGFFGVADRFAAGRIRVTDVCEQCGHCTATCTSNVRVHEEVKLYGMVVDPGCMKCMDCISVCPNDALYFGFGKLPPSPVETNAGRTAPSGRNYDVTLLQEIVMLIVFLGTTMAVRGLYDGPPLLMSVALGVMTAFAALQLWRLFREPTVRIQNLRLKTAGRLGGSGRVFVAMSAAWLAFVVHSGFVQWHRTLGTHYLNLTEAGDEVFSPDGFDPSAYSPRHARAAEASFRHFKLADRWGVFDTDDVKRGLTWLHLLHGEDASAERRLREAIALTPNSPTLHEHLVAVQLKRGDAAGAIESMRTLLTVRPPTPSDHARLAGLLLGQERWDEAVAEYRACLALQPAAAEVRYNLGGLLGRIGRFDEAVDELRRADALAPNGMETQLELAIALAGAGRIADAVRTLEQARTINPDDPRPDQYLATLREQSPADRR
ncbi:MAG: tetratricopeptide repeat protein [Phycisphaerales bacterium]|nr:tetratricopeptide repeat protein [Phycisphaerales bacterium]